MVKSGRVKRKGRAKEERGIGSRGVEAPGLVEGCRGRSGPVEVQERGRKVARGRDEVVVLVRWSQQKSGVCLEACQSSWWTRTYFLKSGQGQATWRNSGVSSVALERVALPFRAVRMKMHAAPPPVNAMHGGD